MTWLWAGIISYGAVELVPPSRYETMYHHLEECLGETGDFDGIEWYGALWLIDDSDKSRLNGVWFENRRIILDFGHIYNPRTVAHEMAHDLNGGGEHEDMQFRMCTETIASWIR